MSNITIRPMEPEDWSAVSRIYLEGIATEHATFQTTCPPYSAWDASHAKECRLVLLADGVTAGDVSVSLELPERYVLGTSPEVYAVYTVNGGDKQESTSVRVPAVLTGLDALLEANAGRELDTASDVKPARTAGMLIAISLACTAAAACATLCVMRVMRLRKTKKQKPSQH